MDTIIIMLSFNKWILVILRKKVEQIATELNWFCILNMSWLLSEEKLFNKILQDIFICYTQWPMFRSVWYL